MKNKKDNTIVRLQLSFLVMIFLITIIAYLGAHNSSKINNHLTIITENIQTKFSLVTDMRSNARERTLALQVMVLADDYFVRDENWMLFNRYGGRFATARLTLLKMEASEEERNLFEEQSQLTEGIVPIQLQIADLASADMLIEAKKLMMEKALPLQNKVFAVLGKLHIYYSNQLEQETAFAHKAYENIITVSWVAGFSAVLLALVTGIWMTKRIHRYQDNLHKLNINLKDIVDDKTNKLQVSELKQRKIVENAIDGILTVTESGVIESVNPSALNIFSLRKNEVVGLNIFELLQFEEQDILKDVSIKGNSQNILESMLGHDKELELLYKNKEGYEIPLMVGFSQNISADYMDYSCFIRDITEQKRIAKLKSDFVSTVSHELRTPLTSIRGSLGLIIGGAVGGISEKVLNLLHLADSNVTRLLSLINDILDMQKLESGKMKFNFQTENILPILERAINENQGYAEQFNVQLKLENSIDNAAVIMDKLRMLQVLANLLSNAIKFSNAGDTVLIKLEQVEKFYRIWVIDTGLGISKEFQEKLFDKFSQEDSSDTKSKGGTGLGLHIVQSILESHGSELKFTTKIDEGTRFYFDMLIQDVTT